MGDLTRAELMDQAGLEAGNTEASSFVRTWLDAWLKRTAKSWSWPMLKKRVQDVAVAASTQSVTVGKGTSTKVDGQGTLTTHHLHRLLNGVLFYRAQSGYNPNGRIFIRPLAGTNPAIDESVSDPAGRKGLPDTCKVRKSANGALTLFLDPVPNIPIYIYFDALWIPPGIGTSPANDSQIPWYPNDKTLLKACKVAMLVLDAQGETDPNVDKEEAKLGEMVVMDRDYDGEEAGDNQIMGLDPSVFVT